MIMKTEVSAALLAGWKLIYVDEAMFTTASRLTHAYSTVRKNISISEAITNLKAIAVVAGVSAEAVLETFLLQEK